jgi:hypothetical protein
MKLKKRKSRKAQSSEQEIVVPDSQHGQVRGAKVKSKGQEVTVKKGGIKLKKRRKRDEEDHGPKQKRRKTS